MTLKAHEKLVRYCNDSEAGVVWGRSEEEEVAALETRYGIQFPADFRAYLLEACPRDFQTDHNNTEWWSLSRIKNFPEECGYELTNAEIARDAGGLLFFADYLIWSWAWAICCRPGVNYGRAIAIFSGGERIVADSFDEFVDDYIQTHGVLV